FFFLAEDGIRDFHVTGVQTCALPIYRGCLATAIWCSSTPAIDTTPITTEASQQTVMPFIAFSPAARAVARATPTCSQNTDAPGAVRRRWWTANAHAHIDSSVTTGSSQPVNVHAEPT